MAPVKDKITFKVAGKNFGRFKLRDKGRRMKLYIKLTKEDTQQWLTLKEALTGGEITDETLARIIFFKGICELVSPFILISCKNIPHYIVYVIIEKRTLEIVFRLVQVK